MNDQESLAFVQTYFRELFINRNLEALDHYLDPSYFDDDIADPAVDHIQNSKEFLAAWFQAEPTIGVEVKDAITQDNVVSAFVEWQVTEKDNRRVIRKGVVIFVLKGRKISKRHTYMYYEA